MDTTRDVLVKTVHAALLQLGSLDDAHEARVQPLAYQLIHSLRLLPVDDNGGSGCVQQLDFPQDLDIFTPVWNSATASQPAKTAIVACLVAYCSVHSFLQPLILQSINNWKLCVGDGNDTARKADSVGFYTLLAAIECLDSINEKSLHFLSLNDRLSYTLAKEWVPMWANGKDVSLQTHLNIKKDVLSLYSNESHMDYFIATSNLQNIGLDETATPNRFVNQLVALRVFQCSKWIQPSLYKQACTLVLAKQKYQSEDQDVQFQLKVLMEIIDHPQLNLLLEPKLVCLLFDSLQALKGRAPFEIHKNLNQMGSTLSIDAMLNIVQFTITQLLLNFDHSVTLPDWFNDEIVPRIPPITKSSFMFQSASDSTPTPPVSYTLQLLYWCLVDTMALNNTFLMHYFKYHVDVPLMDPANKKSLNHILIHNHMNLYNIPMIASLLLSEKLSSSSLLLSRLLSIQSIKISENLIKLHGNIAIFHLIKFINKISLQDLSLQKISIRLLNHLFFHNINDNNESLIDDVLHNKLSLESLKELIQRWNDGSSSYSLFYQRIFMESQPSSSDTIQRTIQVRDLYKYLPKDQQQDILHAITTTATTNTTIQRQMEQPQPQKSMKSYIQAPSSANKFNAYNSTSFVPSTTGNGNNNNNNNYLFTTTPSNNSNNIPPHTPQINTTSTLYNHPQHQPQPHNHDNNKTNNFHGSTTTTTSDDSMNNELMMHQTDTFSAFSTPFTLSAHKTSEMMNSTPKTPNTINNNPWNESPHVVVNNSMSASKIVSTGKNYILGGHNRVKNNSRAQSIHIDQFQDPDA